MILHLISVVRVAEWPYSTGVLARVPSGREEAATCLQVFWTDGPADTNGGTNEVGADGYLLDFPADIHEPHPRIYLVTTDPSRVRAWAHEIAMANEWWYPEMRDEVEAAPVLRLGGAP